MAFHWQTFKTRTLTAIVFAVVMLVGLLWNHWSFFILFSIIHFGCWWEYLKLVEKIHQIKFHNYLKFGLMLMGYGLMIFAFDKIHLFLWNLFELGDETNLFFLVIPIAGLIISLIGYSKTENISFKSFGPATSGLLYISLTLGLMILLRGVGVGSSCLDGGGIGGRLEGPFTFAMVRIPLAIIFSLWINDTMAYIVGSIIGKKPLSKISPKKTWEGTIGGVILCILIMTFVGRSMNIKMGDAIFISSIASIAGTFGDLFESKLKRMAGVKDSGHIMPGHGGFLDRFDSLLFAVPFVWLYVYFFMK